jgi:hypothetical protein
VEQDEGGGEAGSFTEDAAGETAERGAGGVTAG